jgi:hypothetical protein
LATPTAPIDYLVGAPLLRRTAVQQHRPTKPGRRASLDTFARKLHFNWLIEGIK